MFLFFGGLIYSLSHTRSFLRFSLPEKCLFAHKNRTEKYEGGIKMLNTLPSRTRKKIIKNQFNYASYLSNVKETVKATAAETQEKWSTTVKWKWH